MPVSLSFYSKAVTSSLSLCSQCCLLPSLLSLPLVLGAGPRCRLLQRHTPVTHQLITPAQIHRLFTHSLPDLYSSPPGNLSGSLRDF